MNFESWLLVFVIIPIAAVTSENDTEECMRLLGLSGSDIDTIPVYLLTDFETTDCQNKVWRRGIITNEFEYCLAKRIAVDKTVNEFWIEFKKEDFNCEQLSGGLWGDEFNFTDDPVKNCTGIRIDESKTSDRGNSNGTWFNDLCNIAGHVLCQAVDTSTTPEPSTLNDCFSDGTAPPENTPTMAATALSPSPAPANITNTQNTTVTTAPVSFSRSGAQLSTITSTLMLLHSTIESECLGESDTAYIDDELSSGNPDVEGVEEKLIEAAANNSAGCASQTGRARMLVRQGIGSYQNFTDLTPGQFSVHEVTLPAKYRQSSVWFSVAQLQINPDVGQEYINGSEPSPDGNKFTKKLFPKNGRMLSFSAFTTETSERVETDSFTFSYDIEEDTTISDKSKNLSYGQGETGLLTSFNRVKNISYDCVTLDTSDDKFRGGGCTCNRVGNRVFCTSEHNSVFAVLFSVDIVEIPLGVKITSIVTLTISLIFLALTFAILLRVRKKIRGERIAVQINLTVSLAFFNIWNLMQDLALMSPAFCKAVAVLTHFFLISSGTWMFIEASLLFLKTSRWAFVQLKRKKVVIISMVMGWGVPTIICGLTAIIGFTQGTYMKVAYLYDHIKNDNRNATSSIEIPKYDICWLSPTSGIRWAAIGPMIVLLTFNIAIAVNVAIFVHQKSKEAKNFKPTENASENTVTIEFIRSLKAPLKAVVLLLPILGIPWIFLFCTNTTDQTTSVAFMYISAIIGGLQGLFVFIVYVIVGKEVRKATVKSITSLTNSWISFSEPLDGKRKKSYSNASNDVSQKGSTLPPVDENFSSEKNNVTEPTKV